MTVGDEGEWWSRADPGNTDMVYDMGARTVVSSTSVNLTIFNPAQSNSPESFIYLLCPALQVKSVVP